MTGWHSGDPEAFEGDVTAYIARPKAEEPDNRYRIMILLQRSGRPKYWTFHCMHCKATVIDLVNADVQAVSDLIDMSTIGNIGVGMRCTGKFCRYWYYFKLN